MEKAPKPSLEYDRSASIVTVRGFRTLLTLTLLNTVVLSWFVVGPQVTPFIQGQWRQWQVKRETRRQEGQFLAIQKQCLTHRILPGTVAYTEKPSLATTLAGQRNQYQTVPIRSVYVADWVSPVALNEPPFWTNLRGLRAVSTGYETANPYPMIFLHERRTPSGQPRVVVVQWVAEQTYKDGDTVGGSTGVETSRLLAARMHSPASRGVPAKLIDHVQVRVRLPEPDFIQVQRARGSDAILLERPAPLTLFAGEPDPADSAHFTIPYTIGDNAGVIDGWVKDDELILQPRHGQSSFVHGQHTWVLGAVAPATSSTRPSTAPQTRS